MAIDRERLAAKANYEAEILDDNLSGPNVDNWRQVVDAILSDISDQGYVIVPREPSFAMKMAGAEAITADHMQKMANYDAACDAWPAMLSAANPEQTEQQT